MITLNLRLPDDIHANLTQVAKDEERSLNAQIIHVIKKYLEEKRLQSKKHDVQVKSKM